MSDIIRCKDCEYYGATRVSIQPICKNINGIIYPDPEDYCSRAKKKLPKLKSCPFCGSSEVFVVNYADKKFGIVCPGCDVNIGTTFDTREAVVETWNRRFY